MSFDLSFVVDVGGNHPAWLAGYHDHSHPTYNLAPMFARALGRGLRSLDGLTGAEILPIVEAALERMRTSPDEYRALEPSNGWGDMDGAVAVLRELAERCHEWPLARLRVS